MKVGIGQDSHRFDFDNKDKKLVLGGIVFENEPALKGNSDADVVLHAIANAISGVTCINVVGKVTDKMCAAGITDSREYVREAGKYLGDYEIEHLSISIECTLPKIAPRVEDMRKNIARILEIDECQVGITATSGEGLTDFGRGEGISVFCIITVE